MSELDKVKLDLMTYGYGFMVDGKRVDPHDVWVDTHIKTQNHNTISTKADKDAVVRHDGDRL